MPDRAYNVLFLCTGNSARSIFAECALNRWGGGRFKAYSAGSQPKGQVHPVTLRVLRVLNYKTDSLRSKDRDEFARPRAPKLDFVFAVCDSAANEARPVRPGQPLTARWSVEDPAAFVGPEEKTVRFFKMVYGLLENRIKIFVNLPVSSLDRMSLRRRMAEIGRMLPADAGAP